MAILGGILLICAALLMFKGKIYEASMLYIAADIAWIYLAWLSSNMIGAALVLIGGILNFGVFLKMHKGMFVKDLKKNNSYK